MRRSVGLLATAAAVLFLPAGANADRPTPSACTITPQDTATFNVGDLQTYFVTTTGCATSQKPVRFKVVDGDIPAGMTLFTQGVSSAGITGRPTTEGIFQFTLQVRDETRTTDTESFQITIDPPRPLTINNESDELSAGTVGEFYCCGNLFADGGVPDYSWSLVAGQLPPGLSLSESPGRITGTPTAAGTFSFTLRVTDDRGATADRTFSITIT
jgi:Putative Ig domain